MNQRGPAAGDRAATALSGAGGGGTMVAGVVVLPGSAFGPGAEGFFRVALTVGTARLREAAERLGKVLAAV